LEINIGEKMGMTGYIDFLTKGDFTNNNNNNYNVVYGRDVTKRFFISVLYKDIPNNIPNNIKDEDEDKDKDHNIMTLFQRYTNEPYFFVSCADTFIWKGDIQMHNFYNNDYHIDKYVPRQFTDFFTLINNGKINITYNANTLYELDDEYFNREKTVSYKLFY
jgi:hypothetical protein